MQLCVLVSTHSKENMEAHTIYCFPASYQLWFTKYIYWNTNITICHFLNFVKTPAAQTAYWHSPQLILKIYCNFSIYEVLYNVKFYLTSEEYQRTVGNIYFSILFLKTHIRKTPNYSSQANILSGKAKYIFDCVIFLFSSFCAC